MQVLTWIIGIILLLLFSQYIVGPILVYRSQRMPTRYKFELLDQNTFIAERSDIFRKLHDEILASEFRYIGSAEIKQSHSSLYFSIYYSEQKTLTCTLVTAEATHSPTTTQIEFTQMYNNGTLLSVSNNSIIGVYPKWKIKDIYRFPEVNSFTKLLSITEKIIGIVKAAQVPKPMIEGKEFETIEAHLNEELDRLVKIGWVSEKIVDNEHKLTPKGAALMTWKMCWPIRAVLDKVSVSRSMKVLNNA